MRNKLILMDYSFLPFEGVFSFSHISESAAVEGIQDAVDGGFLLSRVGSLHAAMRLSHLTDREILTVAEDVDLDMMEMNMGDAVLMCPHLSATRAERRRNQIPEVYIFVMSIDITSPRGLADKIVSAKPDTMLYHDWMTQVGEACGDEMRYRVERGERKASVEEGG